MTMPTIAFVGLGIMGRPMAGHLISAGYALRLYNRTAARMQPLADQGATPCDTPAEAASSADVIVTMVSDTPDVEAVLFGADGASAGAREGAVVIDMSTIRPDVTADLAKRLAEQGVAMLDAPVSGGDVGAQNATLTIMVGGDVEVFEAMKPIFEVLGSTITRVGGNGAGQATKACNQVLGSITLLGVCEALTLAQASGLDLETFIQVAAGGAAQSWMIENLGGAIAKGNLAPGFMVDLMQKDLGIVLSSAATLDVPTLGTALANQLYRSVQADGHGSEGIQAMILAYEALASRRVRPE